jgi:HEPN domain-containing protein
MAQDRQTFLRLAVCRLAEAKILEEAGQASGAYYLAGYAVECALKAKIAAQFRADEFPDKSLVNRAYTHRLDELARLAGIDAVTIDDIALKQHWSIVVAWSEHARYDEWSSDSAKAMIEAVERILSWLTDV